MNAKKMIEKMVKEAEAEVNEERSRELATGLLHAAMLAKRTGMTRQQFAARMQSLVVLAWKEAPS